MFTLISEGEELGNLFADVLKDENGYTALAVEVPFPLGRGRIEKYFIVYLDKLPDFLACGVDFGAMQNCSYKAFETHSDFCRWCSYNLTS